jgi:hypothetical protein
MSYLNKKLTNARNTSQQKLEMEELENAKSFQAGNQYKNKFSLSNLAGFVPNNKTTAKKVSANPFSSIKSNSTIMGKDPSATMENFMTLMRKIDEDKTRYQNRKIAFERKQEAIRENHHKEIVNVFLEATKATRRVRVKAPRVEQKPTVPLPTPIPLPRPSAPTPTVPPPGRPAPPTRPAEPAKPAEPVKPPAQPPAPPTRPAEPAKPTEPAKPSIDKAAEAAKERAREEAARKAREEAARKAKEATAKKEADKRRDDRTADEERATKEAGEAAKREADRKAREETAKKAKEEAERKAREEAARKAREAAAKREADKRRDDRTAEEERATREAGEAAKREAAERAAAQARREQTAERVREGRRRTQEEARPTAPSAPPAQPAPPTAPRQPTTRPPTATRQPQGLGREGAGLIGLNALQRQAAIKKELFALGVTPVVAAGVMLVAAKETEAGVTLTEYGPQAYKDTWRNYESGKNKIPGDKYAKIKANPQKYLPGATSETLIPQSGPGAGTAYMNFTFQKFLTTEQWRKMIDAPNSDDFFATVGYKGGEKYKGRSLIGVTHEGNYAAIGKLLGLDLVNNPELINRDVKTTTAATLAYLALTASGGIFNWKNLTQEKLKGSYQEGLKIINSYTNVDDLNKLLMLLTAGKGNVDVRNVEQVRAAFSGNSTRAILLRQQLESGVKTFKALGLDKEELQPVNVSSLGNNLSQMSSNNSDMRRNMASLSPTVIISQQTNTNKNTMRNAPSSQPNINPMLG